MQWWPPISVTAFPVKDGFDQPCSGTEQLQSDNLQWAISRESELLHQTLGSCFSTFSLAGTPASQNIVTFTRLWRVNSVHQRDYLSDLYWDVGGGLSGRHVPSHLEIYGSKLIAQTPLGYQQTDSGTLKETNGCSLFTKARPGQKRSGFILCSWHIGVHAYKINFFVSQSSVPMLRLPDLCPTS